MSNVKPGKALDSNIAIKIMGQKIEDPFGTPNYSTDIFDSYLVVGRLQQMGWSCSIRSSIIGDGGLSYKVVFTRGNIVSQNRASTIPMAVCSAALAIADDEYFEYVQENKNQPTEDEDEAEILDIKTLKKKDGLKISELVDENLEDELVSKLAETIYQARFVSETGDYYFFRKLVNRLVKQKAIPEDFNDKLPIQLAQLVVDKLQELGCQMKRNGISDQEDPI